MSRRYPLEKLAGVRAQQVSAAAADMQKQRKIAEQAEARAKQAQHVADEHATAVASVHEEEAARLAQGELRAADLRSFGAWAHTAERTTAALRSAESAKRAELQREEAALHEREQQLVKKEREAEVLSKHEKRWTEQEAKRAEDAQAEEIEDQWRRR